MGIFLTSKISDKELSSKQILIRQIGFYLLIIASVCLAAVCVYGLITNRFCPLFFGCLGGFISLASLVDYIDVVMQVRRKEYQVVKYSYVDGDSDTIIRYFVKQKYFSVIMEIDEWFILSTKRDEESAKAYVDRLMLTDEERAPKYEVVYKKP